VTTGAIMAAPRASGWSVGERATDRGHVAEAGRGGRRVSVTARSSALA
jgi:hypothetical protein